MPLGKPAAAWGVTLAAAGFFLAGCTSGPSASSRKAINGLMAQENFAGAEQYIDHLKDSQYKKKNMVLYYLDKGLVEHHEGKYKESDESLDTAERRMEELYTASVSRTAGMFVLNDNTSEYAGEPFEHALTNVFRALNYVFMGQLDDALVESRKVEQFLQELNDKLGGKKVYKDDAFAHYLNSMLFADEGKMDDARISLQAANDAYGWYVKDYNTPLPHFDFPASKDDHGELVFIHYNGVSPRKFSRTYQIAWGQAMSIAQQSDDPQKQQFNNSLAAGLTGNAITVAFPEYVQDPYAIKSSEVVVDSGAASGSTILMEDVTAIAMKGLKDRIDLVRARAIARATIKFVIAQAAAKAVKDTVCRQYGGGSLQCALAGLTKNVGSAIAAGTEVADIRSWGTLPSQIRMSRLKLSPGKHNVLVKFKDASGAVVQSYEFKDVNIVKSQRTYLSYRTAL
jgi:hypothetical protein